MDRALTDSPQKRFFEIGVQKLSTVFRRITGTHDRDKRDVEHYFTLLQQIPERGMGSRSMSIDVEKSKKMFGVKGAEIEQLLEDLKTAPLLANVGKQIADETGIVRVWSFIDGWNAISQGRRNLIRNFQAIQKLHDTAMNKGLLTQANWDNASSLPSKLIRSMKLTYKDVKIDESVHLKIAAWASNAALETLVSFMPGTPNYFRTFIPWYKAGYWPAAIRDEDGKLVIY